MKAARGSQRARRSAHDGDAAARARVEALFADLDRLTPDELARVGLERADPVEHAALRAELAGAARRSGRSALVREGRVLARETMLRRISSGGLQPTWVALNWGVSQGTAENRTAIVEAVEDAVAAAVVADVADPDVVEAMSLPASRIASLSSARASGGSYAAVSEPPAGPEYRDSPVRLVAAGVAGILIGVVLGQGVSLVFGTAAGFAVWIATIVGMVMLARRSSRQRSTPLPDEADAGRD